MSGISQQKMSLIHPLLQIPSSVVTLVEGGWKKSVMMVSVAVSVAGIATAFFAQSLLAGVGFGFLAITAGLGLWIVKTMPDVREIETITKKLDSETGRLQAAEKRILECTAKIESQKTEIARLQADLQSQLRQLSESRGAFEQLVRLLQQANLDLRKNNQDLTQANNDLTQRIAELSTLLERFKEQIKGFLELNLAFGNQVQAFHSSVDVLKDKDVALRSAVGNLDRVFDENLKDLSSFLDLAKTSSEQIFAFICQQKEQLQAQLRILEGSTIKIAELDRLIAEKLGRIDQQEHEIQAQVGVLKQLQQEVAQEKETWDAALRRRQVEREEEKKILTEQREALQRVREALEVERKRWESIAAQVGQELQVKIDLKKREIAALDAEIQARKATLDHK